MSVLSAPRRGSRWSSAALTVAAAAFMTACGAERTATDPTLPGNPPTNTALRRAAFIMDVNTRSGAVKITAPTPSIGGLNASLVGGNVPGRGPIQASILAGDVIDLTATNFSASAVGAFVPGKVRVRFDVYLTNKLTGANLIASTFPPAPAGTTGPLLFPFEAVVTTNTPGVSVGGDGTEIIVELPNTGQVDASTDFDGDLYNFFNDAGCGAGSNDCFRYQEFAGVLGAGATSLPEQVGFDIDPTVSNFRVRLIVAADLQNSSGPATGGLQGRVTSPQRGDLTGVNVTVNPGSFVGTTGATVGGVNYTISGINTGPKSVSLSNLPAGCTDPGAGSVTIGAGSTSTLNFTVQCTPLTGTVAGTITSSLGGGLDGITVTVTPAGGAAQAGVLTAGGGLYSRGGVPLGTPSGTGSVTLSNLPANCTNPGATPYSGLVANGSVTVDITVPCTPPPQGYPFTTTWGTPSGGQVILTFAANMNGFDDPAIPGADNMDIFQGSFTYNTTRLSFVSCANVAGSPFDNASANQSSPGTVQILNFATTPGAGTGNLGVLQCTFNVISGTPAGVSVVVTPTIAASDAGVDLIPRLLFNNGVLP